MMQALSFTAYWLVAKASFRVLWSTESMYFFPAELPTYLLLRTNAVQWRTEILRDTGVQYRKEKRAMTARENTVL